MAKMLRPALFVAFLAWMAIWFWAFSFAYSSSFFQYDLGTCLPFLFLSLLAAAVPPLSSYWVLARTIRIKSSATRAGLLNLVISALPLLLFSAVYFLWVFFFRDQGELPLKRTKLWRLASTSRCVWVCSWQRTLFFGSCLSASNCSAVATGLPETSLARITLLSEAGPGATQYCFSKHWQSLEAMKEVYLWTRS